MLPIDIKEFIEFNKQNFPKRKGNSEQTLIKWRIKSNPYFTNFDKGLISTHEGKMDGQIIPVFSKFVTNEVEYSCVWGSDYIVAKNSRGGSAGVKVIKTIIKSYLHFGVGMSDISLKIHKVFKEKCIGTRYDCLFLSTKKTKRKFQIEGIEFFMTNFDSLFSNCYTYKKSNFFIRNSKFYNWIFHRVNRKKLKVVWDTEMKDFVIFYRSSYRGFPLTKIVDFNPRLNEEPQKLVELIRFYGQQSISSKIFFYSGGIDVTKFFRSYRVRNFPIYSNADKFLEDSFLEKKIHITGLDSDRFISEFL